MEQIKINSLQIENVKRIKSVVLEPTSNGLTVIGGRNNQGKTSVLDSIAWALGGEKFRPSNAKREDSLIPPSLKVTLSNGLVVERKGKNSDLKVIDPSGQKAGQSLLNQFIEELAINLPKFINSTAPEKTRTLLSLIGIGDELEKLESDEVLLYNRRLAIGQIATQKEKHAKEMQHYPDAPSELISARELIDQQQEILRKNAENAKKRMQLVNYSQEVKRLETKKAETDSLLADALLNLATAQKSAQDLADESTEELERNLDEIETINVKVRSNFDKEKAEQEAQEYKENYQQLTDELAVLRKSKVELLQNADLPLSELTVENGELKYKNKAWDSMSGSDQLKVSTAIVRKLNPNCGFVLVDKLEQMDSITLQEFSAWAKDEGLQIIATRVSTGDECAIVIEDGYSDTEQVANEKIASWKDGEF